MESQTEWNHKENNITDKMLQSMAKEFVKLRGDNNLYVFTKHAEPGKHVHLHVAMSATKLNGMSSRVTKAEYASLKLSMDAYQKANYNLNHSLPQHGKSKNNKVFDKEAIKNKKIADRGSVKNELLKYVESISLSAISTKQFFSIIEKQGFKTYSRNGKITGLQHENGLKFRFSRLNIDLDKMLQRDATILKEEESLKKLRNNLNRSKTTSNNTINQKQTRIDRMENMNLQSTGPEPKTSNQEQDNKTVELDELGILRDQANTVDRDNDDGQDTIEELQKEDNGQDNQKDNADGSSSSSTSDEDPIFNN